MHGEGDPHRRAEGRIALRVALTYAAVAAAWIVLSDAALSAMGIDGSAPWQTVKGIGFVLVTGGALFMIVKRATAAAFRASRDAEEAHRGLAASERRYRQLFEANPRPMWVYDLDTLAFIDVNDAAVGHYGYTREEFLGMTIADIRPAEDVPDLLRNVAEVTEGVDFAGTWRHRTKDGRIIVVEITSHVLEHEGRRAELVLADDVTALVEATAELSRTARRLSALVETSPVAIVIVDKEGRVTLWNAAAERIFGWTQEQVLGVPVPIVPDDERETFRQGLAYTLDGGGAQRIESKSVTRDGRLIDTVVYTGPLCGDSGEVEEVIGMLVDVSERTRAEAELALHREHLEQLVEARTRELANVNEQLRRATRIKSEFLANMSHELRTPLNSIIGFSGILLQGMAGELSEEQLKQVGMVNRSGRHLLDLINDILDLSRIEAGRVEVDLANFDLAAMIRAVCEDMRPLADAKGLSMEVDAPAAFGLRSDRTKVRQILYNLVGNAIKFTDEGRIDITLRTTGERVAVSVADTGPGVAEGDREAIFDEFHQARRRADEKPAGTGLGLAISRKLARMLGGDISLASVPGEGSVFTLELPMAVAAAPLSTARQEPADVE